MPAKPKNTDTLWADFGKAVAERDSSRLPEGKGWMTAEQISKKFNLRYAATMKMVGDELRAKRMEVFKGAARNATGGYSQAIWYRPKKP